MTDVPNRTERPPSPDRLLPWPKVKDLTGLSRTTAWRLQNAAQFPRPLVISPGRVGWRESEVAAWKAQLTARNDSPSPQARATAPRRPPSADVMGAPPAQPVKSRDISRQAGRGTPAPPPGGRRKVRRRAHPSPDQLSFDF